MTVASFRKFAGFGAALSLANLFMLSVWDEFQDRSFDYLRDQPYITWSELGSALLHLFFLAILLWALLLWSERVRRPAGRKISCIVVVLVVLAALDVTRTHALHLFFTDIPAGIWKMGFLAIGAVLGGALAFAVLFRERQVMKMIRSGLIVLLPLIPINLAAAAWMIRSAEPAERFQPDRPLPLLASPRPAPRFIWVIFDEWDYYRTFRSRSAALKLPEIDRFQAQSLHADAVTSPMPDTQESVPSLITGRLVTRVDRIAADDLLLNLADTPHTQRWSSLPNVFTKARELGVNCALTGFYHAYPRVFGDKLVESSSISSLALFEEPEYWTGAHGLEKVYRMGQSALLRVPLLKRSGLLGNWRERETSRLIYLQVRDRAQKLLRRPEIGLVFLHFPIPHPLGFYDRKRDQLTTEKGSYDDNLALVDRTLGELRATMESSGQWENSFVLLTTDHPLRRVPRHEEIPFMLKAPGQRDGLSYHEPFNSILTQDLILAALRGEFRTAREASQWLDSHRLNYIPGHPVQAAHNQR